MGLTPAILTNIFSFLLALHVGSSLISQSLVDITHVLCTILLVYFYVTKKNQFKWDLNFSLWPMAGYFAIVLIGYYFNGTFQKYPIDSLKKFIWVPNLIILYLCLLNFKLNLRLFLVSLAAIVLGPSIYGLLSFIFSYDYMTKVSITRVVGLVNSATYHAHAGGLILAILIGLHLYLRKKMNRSLNLFLYFSEFVLLISVFLTFTRGIWLALIISAGTILVFYSFKRWLIYTLSVTIAVFLLTTLSEQFKDRVENTTVSANQERIDLMKVNWQMFQEYPWLGIGYGENLRRNREYWDRSEWNKPADYITSHAHNQYLNVLSTTGLLGFIFFVIFVFRFSFTSLMNIFLAKFHRINIHHKKPLLFAIGWMNLEFLLSCMTDVTFEYAKIRSVVLVIWALSLVVEKKGQQVFNDELS